jgi:RNA polymerase sigma-70 factor (ECF subfamily)
LQAALRASPGESFSAEFEALFEAHYELVYRTAFGVTGRVEDADDVVQTVFLRLLQQPAGLLKNPRAYLYRAAVNVALTVVAARRRRAATEEDEERALAIPARVSSDAEEQHRRLYDAIAQLPRRAADIVVLRYLHNYSDAEFAKLLGTSRGVIAVTLYRSRARLKALMNKSGEES